MVRRVWLLAAAGLVLAGAAGLLPLLHGPAAPRPSAVPGQAHQICSQPARYLTSPWTYHALGSGRRTYTVAQYRALPGYGRTLPPLPGYIGSEKPSATAAVIYAPGSPVAQPSYTFPETPLLYFFEGGRYGRIDFDSVPGDEFIGGSAPGHPEPAFDDGGAAAGIDAQNATYDFSGGAGTLASSAPAGARTITTRSPIHGYLSWLTLADGTTYPIARVTGPRITLVAGLAAPLRSGSTVYAAREPPIARVTSAAGQGTRSVRLGAASTPLLRYARVVIGADSYLIDAAAAGHGGHSLRLSGGLDFPVRPGTPVYYGGPAGDVSVDYLDISHDLHLTTGTLYTGTGWTITHDDIHDGHSTPGYGVAIYGGDHGVIEYNCLSRMGDYGVNLFGTDSRFDDNEVYESNDRPDPGCGCSGGGKWWGTLNADIVGNAFIRDGPAGGVAVWLDNGNSGTRISGNYFYLNYGSAVTSETGFNLDVSDNLFEDDGWGKGSGGCADNCDGAVNLNSSGGFGVPGSRFENRVLISGNQFINDWQGVDIWQAGARSCENSGEGWPADAAYCSGGYPTTASTSAGGSYYFSHAGDHANGGATSLASPAAAGSSTILVAGATAIGDRIGFGEPAATRTSDRAAVTALTGSGTIRAATAGFPASGELRVGTSAAWTDGGGSYTGAILAYRGTTRTSFTGVSLLRGSGTLSGPVLEVQPYQVTAENCAANDCRLTVAPRLTAPEAAGSEVSNAGTCQLYATSSARPAAPLAPDGVSYWAGCQWIARDISVTGNQFRFDPAAIAHGAPLAGGRRTTTCTSAHADSCGTNFMAYQVSGEAPFDTPAGAGALMSSTSVAGCPSWDPGCRRDPLSNLTVLARVPGAAADRGGLPDDNVWSDNSYRGPWGWYAYVYGTCQPLPADRVTSKRLPASACGILGLSQWRSIWQQDGSAAASPAAAR